MNVGIKVSKNELKKQSFFKDVYNSKYRSNLLKLNKKFGISNKLLVNEIRHNKKQFDYIIFRLLNDYHSKLNNKYDSDEITDHQIKKSKIYAKIIKNVLFDMGIIAEKETKNTRKYLDIGCEDFFIPSAVGEAVNAKQISCINIDNWESSSYNIEIGADIKNVGCNGKKCIINGWTNPKIKFDFKYYNGWDIPYSKSSIDVISAFMVIHHVEKFNKLLKSIHSVLKKGGVFIIRDHNCPDDTYAKLLDLVHYYYDIVIADNTKIPAMIDYKTNYYTSSDLIGIVEKAGFKMMKYIDYKHSDAFFAFFVKI